MDENQEKYFKALTTDRQENAKTLAKPSMSGIKKSVVEKYSDQAHFIYELLQNADDAHATRATFDLQNNRLVFSHNGTKHFTVTNPENEDIDTQKNTLGDINAITSIANSNKTESSIGKFGLGFKAVFQYTDTPHIYDPNVFFKIEQFIVPIRLNKDYPDRQDDETIFEFPFDNKKCCPEKAYAEISEKLRSLNYPLLFLSSLKTIKFKVSDNPGLYGKTVEETRDFAGTTAEFIRLTQNKGNEREDLNMLWLFTRKNEKNIHTLSDTSSVKMGTYCQNHIMHFVSFQQR